MSHAAQFHASRHEVIYRILLLIVGVRSAKTENPQPHTSLGVHKVTTPRTETLNITRADTIKIHPTNEQDTVQIAGPPQRWKNKPTRGSISLPMISAISKLGVTLVLPSIGKWTRGVMQFASGGGGWVHLPSGGRWFHGVLRLSRGKRVHDLRDWLHLHQLGLQVRIVMLGGGGKAGREAARVAPSEKPSAFAHPSPPKVHPL